MDFKNERLMMTEEEVRNRAKELLNEYKEGIVMSKKTKITLLELLVLVIFLIISNFAKIEAFSFCLGATYIVMFDEINKVVGDE